MLRWALWLPLKLLRYWLTSVGLISLVLAFMIATPLKRPPELTQMMTDARKGIDLSTLPPLERFQARDGTSLGYRHYVSAGTPAGRGAVVVHGSSAHSATSIHMLNRELAGHGVEAWSIDIRGHGASGTHGDIAYVGQLEDDLADFVAAVRQTAPSLPLTLIGHSSGGGFALRVASSPIRVLFARTVLLAPYLGYDAPSSRVDAGGWASPDIPRIVGLQILRRFGIDCCASLPTVAFAVPPHYEKILTGTYSDRLMRNFATRSYKEDFAAVTGPMIIIAGADDELMIADKYAEIARALAPSVDVKLIEGINHMALVAAPAAVSFIANEVVSHQGS